MNTATTQRAFNLATELRPSILRLSRQLRRESNQSGSSSLDIQILKEIGLNPGTTVAELAAAEQITRPAMSEHIKRLALRGYVKRADAKHDRPGSPVDLSLTRTGRQYLEAIGKRRKDWLISRLDQLSASERLALDRATRSLRVILDGPQSSI